MKKISFLLLCSVLMSFTACNEEYPELEDGIYAEFKTNHGTFIAELFYEETPMTVASFVSLAEGESAMAEEEFKKKKFYNGLIFHRIIKDFMIQGGDPSGTGQGGPGYKFPNEIVDTLKHSSKGILSMANSGPDTNGSQFFITLKETPWLDGKHTVFGKIAKGQEIVDQIGSVETGPGDKPVEPVVMEEVKIIRKGSDAKKFKAANVLSDELENFKAAAEAKEKALGELRTQTQTRLDSLKTTAKELESGLKIAFLKEGEGPKPKTGETVLVHYNGFLNDGFLFDTSDEEMAKKHDNVNDRKKSMGMYNKPMPVLYSPDAPMIAGFKEGVQQMKVGDKAVIFIPAHLGYGERGYPPVIPPGSDLIFEIEIVSIQ